MSLLIPIMLLGVTIGSMWIALKLEKPLDRVAGAFTSLGSLILAVATLSFRSTAPPMPAAFSILGVALLLLGAILGLPAVFRSRSKSDASS